MDSNGLVTITTDFGTQDIYAGVIKGVIYTMNSYTHIIDITNDIPAHDILNAAFTLVRAYEYFPEGTVHMAVVDPGVGGERMSVAIRTDHYYFVGPDNGIFTMVFQKEPAREIREIKNSPFIRDNISSTFHGRDVFAPCAGALAAGKDFSRIGPRVKSLVDLDYPHAKIDGNVMKGEILTVDSFGNLISNISAGEFNKFAGNRNIDVYFATDRFDTVRSFYGEVSPGDPLLLFGSSGFLEVSMNGGSASTYYMTSVGSTITIRRS